MKEKGTIFLSGICGSGMKPLALLAAKLGYRVRGTDRGWNNDSVFLDAGIIVQKEPAPLAASACDLYVFSSAIDADHPERLAATVASSAGGFPRILHRMDLLTLLTDSAETQFALAGTHGKTSSTSMAGWLLLQVGLDPTILAGGRPLYLPEGFRTGAGEIAVYETDESDGSFLRSKARHRLLLNVDRDHLNHYGSFEALCDAFTLFASTGSPVLYAGDPVLGRLTMDLAEKDVTPVLYGPDESSLGLQLSRRSPFYGGRFDEGDTLYLRVHQKDRNLFEGISLRLSVPGRHFAMNALGVLALIHSAIQEVSELSRRFDPEDPKTMAIFAEIMNEFPGVERRLQRIGTLRGIPIYDDYGHHPTEIRAVLDALTRRGERPLCVVFQPHRYTRTRDLAEEFAHSLEGADRVYLLPLYSAGEAPIDGISSESIGSLMNTGVRILDADGFGQIFDESWGAVLFLGAGSVSTMARDFLARNS